jgi:hypothetical protein
MKTIVWDIDDVLNDLMRSWFEISWKKDHAGTSIIYADIKENPPHKFLGMDELEYLISLDKFRLSPEAAEMKPDRAVLGWFKDDGASYRHIALTARPIKTVAPAVKWLMRHYGEWFQTVSFVPSKRPDEQPRQPDKSKADFLSWIGRVDYFIDDLDRHVNEAAGLGIRSFLVAQPWNDSKLRLTEILELIGKESRY